MTTEEKVPVLDQEGLMECPECGEMLSLEEILLHLACKRLGVRF